MKTSNVWCSVHRLAHDGVFGGDDPVSRDPVVGAALVPGVAQAVVHALCARVCGEDGQHRLGDVACARHALDELDEAGPEALSSQALVEMDLVDVEDRAVVVRGVVVGEHEGGEAEDGVGAALGRAQQQIHHVGVEHLVALPARVPAHGRSRVVVARRGVDEAEAGVELARAEVESGGDPVERDGAGSLGRLVGTEGGVLAQQRLHRLHAREGLGRVHGGEVTIPPPASRQPSTAHRPPPTANLGHWDAPSTHRTAMLRAYATVASKPPSRLRARGKAPVGLDHVPVPRRIRPGATPADGPAVHPAPARPGPVARHCPQHRQHPRRRRTTRHAPLCTLRVRPTPLRH